MCAGRFSSSLELKDEIPLTEDRIQQFINRLSSVTSRLEEQVAQCVKLHIFKTAKFYVCTAASAVKLPMRVENELSGLEDILEGGHDDGMSKHHFQACKRVNFKQQT